jgi:hypothetical protein
MLGFAESVFGMGKADEYRANAAECQRMAERTKNTQLRAAGHRCSAAWDDGADVLNKTAAAVRL